MGKIPRYFQWVAGESAGQVVKLTDVFVEDGDTYYGFDNGDMCNVAFVSPIAQKPAELKNMFMVEVLSPDKDDLWSFATPELERREVGDKEFVTIPPLSDITRLPQDKNSETGEYTLASSSVGVQQKIPPKRMAPVDSIMKLPDLKWFGDEKPSDQVATKIVQQVNTEPGTQLQSSLGLSDEQMKELEAAVLRNQTTKEPLLVVEHHEQTDEEKAVALMVKTAKKHDTEVSLTVHINLPSKSIYNIIKEEYENGDELFVNEVIKHLGNEEITRAIKEGLKVAYASE